MQDFKQTTQIRVAWPSPQDYDEAVQNPQHSLSDPVLSAGVAETNALGLPRVVSGMFASVYRFQCQDADWALRCFLRRFEDHQARYEAIEQYLLKSELPYVVGFDFQKNGILVHGNWFPILKMEWCPGVIFTQWIAEHLDNRDALAQMAQSWKQMMLDLKSAGIAHGDLQHGNVLVNKGELKLVDYDGMYLPTLANTSIHELGHRNYQHPGRKEENYAEYIDNFSAWLIYCSIQCLSLDPGLWKKLRGGDECLLLRQSDFKNPERSRAFHLLESHAIQEIRQYGRILRYLLSLKVVEIPCLDNGFLEVPADFADLPARPVEPVEPVEEIEPEASNLPWYSEEIKVQAPPPGQPAFQAQSTPAKAQGQKSSFWKSITPILCIVMAVYALSMIGLIAIAISGNTQKTASPPTQQEILYRQIHERANANDPQAQYEMGSRHLYGNGIEKDPARALYWYKRSADQNNAGAQYMLGEMYLKGIGVGKDNEQAFHWYQKSADQGYAKAQCNLGVMYALGLGVDKDTSQAFHWYGLAAKQGNANAQLNLAYDYEQGIGTEKDYKQAAHWYDLAAVQGNAKAQLRLGKLFSQGLGVVKNQDYARSWYLSAAAQGNEEAKALLEKLKLDSK